MPTLVFTKFEIDPLASSATNAVITINYTYQLTLDIADVHAAGSAYIAGLLKDHPQLESSQIEYSAGRIFLSDGNTHLDLKGEATTGVWGDDPGDRIDNYLLDDDDEQLVNQDRHDVACKTGVQTIPRTFTVASRNLNEDSASQDEIYILLTIKIPGLPDIVKESPTLEGNWA